MIGIRRRTEKWGGQRNDHARVKKREIETGNYSPARGKRQEISSTHKPCMNKTRTLLIKMGGMKEQ